MSSPLERSLARYADSWWGPSRTGISSVGTRPATPLDRLAFALLLSGLLAPLDLRRARWCADPPSRLLHLLLLARLRRGQGSVLESVLVGDLESLCKLPLEELREDPHLAGLPGELALDRPALHELLATAFEECASRAPFGQEELVQLVQRPTGRVFAYAQPRAAEERLSERLRERLGGSLRGGPDSRAGAEILDREPALHGRQKLSVTKSLLHRTLVVAGGPGTGKTTVVARILEALSATDPGWNPGKVALCAPTGRAKSRLQESIERQFPSEISAHTLHSLLGQRPDGTFRHDENDPLPFDTVVVDEASMIDQAMFCGLLEALRDETRLIVLGDPDQLPSVDAGAVFGDLVAHLEALPESIELPFVRLVHTWRNDGDIRRLADETNRGETSFARSARTASIADISCPDADRGSVRWLSGTLEGTLHAWWNAHLPDPSMTDSVIIANLARSRILCAAHGGNSGRERINEIGDAWLRRRQAAPTPWMEGRPLLLTRNLSSLDLWNGDLGLSVLPDETPSVAFAKGDGVVVHPVARLEGIEPAWAITIHKSQGSEFDHVLLVLPDDDTPLLTRQILYTGLTRARKTLWIWGRRDLWDLGAARREDRSSPLFDLG